MVAPFCQNWRVGHRGEDEKAKELASVVGQAFWFACCVGMFWLFNDFNKIGFLYYLLAFAFWAVGAVALLAAVAYRR